jgi:hypothetical protein
MSALDEITKEKQRVSEALARVDAQRDKLAGQLSELEAAERVLARYSKGITTSPATPARSRGRPRNTTATTGVGQRSSPSLADQVLALATGKTQQEVAAACKGLARTMSAWPSPGTSGPAASRSATESSMRRNQTRKLSTAGRQETAPDSVNSLRFR